MGDEERDDLIEDEDEGGEQAQPSSAEASKIVKILLYVAGGILAIVLVAGISYLISKMVQESSYQKRQDMVAAQPAPPLKIFKMESFSKTTNDAEPHFIKLTLSLGYKDNMELQNELINRKVQIRDIINTILHAKKHEELKTIISEMELKDEIRNHINMILVKGKVEEIYFAEFIIN